jgi:hypothetical protein
MENRKRKDDLQRKDSIPKNEAATSSEILSRGNHLFIFFFNSLVAHKNSFKRRQSKQSTKSPKNIKILLNFVYLIKKTQNR